VSGSRCITALVGGLGLLLVVACRSPTAYTAREDDGAAPAPPDCGDEGGDNGDDATTDAGGCDVARPGSGSEASPGTGAACTPKTCKELGYDCGTAGDGCGGKLSCGTCSSPSTCSGGGAYNHCGTFPFQGRSCLMVCSQLPASANCNQLSDGCGNLMALCGSNIECSVASQGTCGGGGVPFQCGSGAKCTPLTCAQLNYNCGQYGDGCSGFIECGSCAQNQICGGGGFNRCGPAASP